MRAQCHPALSGVRRVSVPHRQGCNQMSGIAQDSTQAFTKAVPPVSTLPQSFVEPSSNFHPVLILFCSRAQGCKCRLLRRLGAEGTDTEHQVFSTQRSCLRMANVLQGLVTGALHHPSLTHRRPAEQRPQTNSWEEGSMPGQPQPCGATQPVPPPHRDRGAGRTLSLKLCRLSKETPCLTEQ